MFLIPYLLICIRFVYPFFLLLQLKLSMIKK